MPRSVVLAGTPRCERCQLPPRWCICAGFFPVDCPLQIDVLIHHRELCRPTSTGRLINRVIPASRRHVFQQDSPPTPASIVHPDRELWILHPLGDPIPAAPSPAEVQVLLLDGSWREAARMLRAVDAWGCGRRVKLPPAGISRYRLRDQHDPGHYSTIEALLFVMQSLGLGEAHTRLRQQFELHVYAGLCARGDKKAAADFLATSPVGETFPELLQTLHPPRRTY